MDWKNSDLISMRGVGRDAIEKVLRGAARYDAAAREKKFLKELDGRLLATLFFEPSTRTQFSFRTAMLRMGGNVIGFSDAQVTSVSKGETVHDTMKFIEGCADIVAIRHPNDGAAQVAADSCGVPVINAGDGANEHPTQALVDLFTMQKEKKAIDGLAILMLGDLKYGRTVHSLLHALCNFNDVTVLLQSPPALKMPSELVHEARGHLKVREVEKLDFSDADVVYATRIQRERFADPDEYKKYSYRIDAEKLRELKSDAVLLHPLPRVGEIDPEIDSDARAAYFRQENNGIPVRMAVLKEILG